MNEKKQNEIKDEKIEGQIDIADQEIEPKVEEPKVEEKPIEYPSQTDEKELPDGVCVCSCGDHISKTKVIETIKNTMVKYEGKVVLAMSEVRDIIKDITNAVNK